jgi:hypothetical protein
MNAADIQSIFLLERYTSAVYFHELLKTWRKFVTLNESCLDRYMRDLPPDARSRPLPLQADVTWGATVLPNLRTTLETLEDGYRQILSGDLNGLCAARGPVSDNRGIVEFSTHWMTHEELVSFEELLSRASRMAFNIDRTEGAYWGPGDLSYDYNAMQRGPLDLPSAVPLYKVVNEPGVRAGDRIPFAGIYVPDVSHSTPQFLNARFEAPRAEILVNYQTIFSPLDGSICGKDPVTEEVECTWHRVTRSSETKTSEIDRRLNDGARGEAGERCRETGYYFSPALPGSRRKFNAGEFMPDLGSDYGKTIWQWDQIQ